MNLVLTADLLEKRITGLLRPFDLSPSTGLVLGILADSETPVSPKRPGVSSLTSKRAEIGRGAAMGLSNAFMSLGRIGGPLWAGNVLDLNLSYPFNTGAAIMLIAFVASLFFLPHETAPQLEIAGTN